MRVALTGAASGIGAAIAAKLSRAGHEVTAFDIADPGPNVARWIATDMSDPASIDAAVAEASGPFDALFNNAGLPPREGAAERVLNVNFLGFRQFLNEMLERLEPGASIVNTASRAGAMWQQNIDEVKALMALSSPDELPEFIADRGIDHIRAYNLSKEAVIVETLSRTEEMIARNLRMNSVSPSAVSTGILDDFVAAFGDVAARNIARVGRPGLPEEIADAAIFLAGPESRWIKGFDLVIDGGTSAIVRTDAMRLN